MTKFDEICVGIVLALLIFLMICTLIEMKKECEAERKIEQTEAVTKVTATLEENETEIKESRYPDSGNPFLFENWNNEDLEGFILYTIPKEYEEKGDFPESIQKYTYCLCKKYDISYSLVLAVIERESGYRYDCIGDSGKSKGYMQIYEAAHVDRMEKIGCTDLLNPYQNITVGIDYLSELINKYGTIQDALAAYNYGEAGAKRNLWSKGIYLYGYNETILKRMKEIEEEMKK